MRGLRSICQADRTQQPVRSRHGAGICAIVVAGMLLGSLLTRPGAASDGQTASPHKPTQDQATEAVAVTPVAGPSWINHLGLPYGETTLGRSAATYGPPAEGHPAATAMPLGVGQPVVLTGADLYRLNCQACHRAEGTGSPPEIKSMLGAVAGSSVEFVRRQLRQQGITGAGPAAREQASRARSDLHTRVERGGQRMPPLSHLSEADFVVLYAYLTHLAGSPDELPQSRVTVSWSRLGEHVIKGTCHICHDAVGPRPTAEALVRGTIPPFTTLLEDNRVVDFLTKVRTGAPVTIGTPTFHYRGRMPVFGYLKELEVAAAYMFLVDYPPQAESPADR